jgi:tRNA uridine 5-carboxymethylaminomethyl modification enzyme
MGLCDGKYRHDAVSEAALGDLHGAVREQIEIGAKYAGYIDRQKEEVQRAAHYEQLRLPDGLDYMQIESLSIEARQRLNKHRPETLGQASRLSGITPATVSLLLVYLKKNGLKVALPKALSQDAA